MKRVTQREISRDVGSEGLRPRVVALVARRSSSVKGSVSMMCLWTLTQLDIREGVKLASCASGDDQLNGGGLIVVVSRIVIWAIYADTDEDHVVVGGLHSESVVEERGYWWKERTSSSTLSPLSSDSSGEVLT